MTTKPAVLPSLIPESPAQLVRELRQFEKQCGHIQEQLRLHQRVSDIQPEIAQYLASLRPKVAMLAAEIEVEGMSETVCRHCGEKIVSVGRVWMAEDSLASRYCKGNRDVGHEPAPAGQPHPEKCTCGAGNYEPLYKHEKDCGLIKFVESPVSTSPAEGQGESSIERQIAICEQNGAKWCNFAVADVKKLLPAAQPSPDAKVKEIAAKIIDSAPEWFAGSALPESNAKDKVVAILRPYFPADAPTLKIGEPCPTCRREYHGEMGPGNYSCAVCGMGMLEPCEHWKLFESEVMTTANDIQPVGSAASDSSKTSGLAGEATEGPSEIEMSFRRYMWLNHGHFESLYGDDGEMQCNRTGCLIDFKRHPLPFIHNKLAAKYCSLPAAPAGPEVAPFTGWPRNAATVSTPSGVEGVSVARVSSTVCTGNKGPEGVLSSPAQSPEGTAPPRGKFTPSDNPKFCICGEKKLAHKGRALYCPEIDSREQEAFEAMAFEWEKELSAIIQILPSVDLSQTPISVSERVHWVMTEVRELRAKLLTEATGHMKTQAILKGANERWMQEQDARKAAESRLKTALESLVRAAIPLEAILLVVDWELSPEVMTAVKEGVEAIRAALSGTAQSSPSRQTF